MGVPSIKTLTGRLGVDGAKAQRLRLIMQQDKMRPLKEQYPALKELDRGTVAEAAMEAINIELGFYGVECLRDGNYWAQYWCDNIAMYANTGETYAPTILFDTDKCRYIVSDVGTWMEAEERRGRNFNP
jgi:hypothetical protein